MMRVAVLTTGSVVSPGWHLVDLQRAATAMNVNLQVCHWRQLHSEVSDAGVMARAGDVTLNDMDLLLLRTMPAGSLEQIILRMDIVGRLVEAGVQVINSPRAVEMAVDKYLALARMAQAGLPVPRTIACQRFDDAMTAYESLRGDVVAKPLFGSEGFGIMRLTDADLAARTFAQLERLDAVIYLQQYIDHGGQDYRLFVLGGEVLTAMRRRHDRDWRTNISRGATGHAHEPTPEQVELAIRAAAACDAFVAGVDVMVDRQGRHWVIEVNAVPGWRELARVTGMDVAHHVLKETMACA